MITASINFLGNTLLADLTCRESELRQNLQKIGVLTVPSFITLDNARTLQIHFSPNSIEGGIIYSIIDPKKDTLGLVNKLCRHVYCMTENDRVNFLEMIKIGEIASVNQGLNIAFKIREKYVMQRG